MSALFANYPFTGLLTTMGKRTIHVSAHLRVDFNEEGGKYFRVRVIALEGLSIPIKN